MTGFRRTAGSAALLLSLAGAPAVTLAQVAYPSQPIRAIAMFPPGSGADLRIRIYSRKLSELAGQPVVVENKPGAGGTLPAQALQSAPADGYTLAQIPLGVFRLPYTTKINWDPVKDISYILNVTGYAFGIVVPTDSPLRTWTHFVAWAKANPGKLSYGSTGTLTSPHLTMELIAQKLGLDLVHVPYKGSADLAQAIVGGHIMAAADSTGFAPLVEAGKIRVLNTCRQGAVNGPAKTAEAMPGSKRASPCCWTPCSPARPIDALYWPGRERRSALNCVGASPRPSTSSTAPMPNRSRSNRWRGWPASPAITSCASSGGLAACRRTHG